MDEETEREYSIAPVRANVWDFVCAFSTVCKGISVAIANGWEVIEATAIAASTERAERDEFKRSAGRDIEAITGGGPLG